VGSNIEVWADYSKDRFESAGKRVDEFRNWARQLGAAVAVVVSLELALVGKVLELKPVPHSTLRVWCLAALLLAVAVQLILLVWLLFIGYRSHDILWPESPVVLADYIFGQDEQETRRVIGAYYAKALRALPRSQHPARQPGRHRHGHLHRLGAALLPRSSRVGHLDLGAYTLSCDG
jgi:hypothetical protein